jgi:hypothetical protein
VERSRALRFFDCPKPEHPAGVNARSQPPVAGAVPKETLDAVVLLRNKEARSVHLLDRLELLHWHRYSASSKWKRSRTTAFLVVSPTHLLRSGWTSKSSTTHTSECDENTG